jgi:predicted CoA-binding protein
METRAQTRRGIDHGADPPDDLRAILARARTIAVFGASPEPWRPSFGVMRYLQRVGYRVVPVNPTAVGETVHGERFHATLQEVPEPIDLVDVFRRPDAVGEAVDQAIAVKAKAVWLQLGIRNDEACARAEAAGLAVVQNRCISVEHSRLMR